MSAAWWIPVAAIILLALALYFWRPRRRKASQAMRFAQAKRRFHFQREQLEARFVQLASARPEPEIPRGAECTFADDVAYVRNRATGELSAFVAVNIAADEAGDGPHYSIADALGSVGLQFGTAVFRLDCDHWVTDGRAILNLSPSEAIDYYRDDLEIVGEEFAHPAS